MSSKINRAKYKDVVEEISKETGYVNKDIDKVIRAFGVCVARRLREDNDKSIFLPNFGEFFIYVKKPRIQYDVNKDVKRYVVYDPTVRFRPTERFLNFLFGSDITSRIKSKEFVKDEEVEEEECD